MKKNVLIKGILLLVVVSILAIGFTGCTPPLPYGTVYLKVYGSYQYDLWVDNVRYFNDVYQGTYTITNVPIGNHYFEAVDSWGWIYGYHSFTRYITSGVNYVYLYP